MDALRRLFAGLLLALGLAVPARADYCITGDPSWTYGYSQGSISMVSYSLNTTVLGVIFRNNTERAFQNVPLNAALPFQTLTNADSYFSSSIVSRYPEGLLSEWQTGPCPLLNEDGVTWLLGQ